MSRASCQSRVGSWIAGRNVIARDVFDINPINIEADITIGIEPIAAILANKAYQSISLHY